MWSTNNHKLKKGVAWIRDVVGFGSSPLGELIRRAGVFTVPAVKAGYTIKDVIFEVAS
jgi:hypothetical protein